MTARARDNRGQMHRFTILFLSVMLLASLSRAADYEYGFPSELKGITLVYIDTGRSVDLRNIMARVIERRLPDVKVLSSTENAELFLVFTYAQLGRKAFAGELVAVRPSGARLRLLATYRHDEEELNDLADEIVKQFVKDYKRRN